MGGTSTDVSRYDGDYEHVFESTTGGIAIQAPQVLLVLPFLENAFSNSQKFRPFIETIKAVTGFMNILSICICMIPLC